MFNNSRCLYTSRVKRTSRSINKASDDNDRSYQGGYMTANNAQSTPGSACVRVVRFFYKRLGKY